MSLKIGFYAGDGDIRRGGAVPYAKRLAKTISESRYRSGLTVSIVEASEANCAQRFFRGVLDRSIDAYCAFTQRGPFEMRSGRQRRISRQFSRFDIVHVPFQSVPTGVGDLPYIVTIHDVQELHFPQYFTGEERLWRAIGNYNAIRDSKAVVVSFEHIKEDLIRFFQCSPDKVFVAPLPFEACLLAEPGECESSGFSQKYSGIGDYILYPAQTWEHKNHLRLIEAYEIARKKTGEKFSLVCTGHTNSYFEKFIEPRIEASQYADSIYFLRVLPESELRWLYEHSRGVVIPTLYEAGSFPLVEAMSLGVPVICGDTTSLPEMIGDRRFVFKPTDSYHMATSICLLVGDESFRAESHANGVNRFRELCSVDVAGFYESLWLGISTMH